MSDGHMVFQAGNQYRTQYGTDPTSSEDQADHHRRSMLSLRQDNNK